MEDEYEEEETNKTPMIVMVLLGVAVIVLLILLISTGSKNSSLSDDMDELQNNVTTLKASIVEKDAAITVLTNEKSTLTASVNQKEIEKQNLTTTLSATNNLLNITTTDLNKALKKVNDSLNGFKFLKIADLVAKNHTWTYINESNPDNYVCVNFSRDLVKELEHNNWTAKTVRGYWYDNITNVSAKNCSQSNYERFNCSHMWVIVSVPVEATTGEIITPEEYADYTIP